MLKITRRFLLGAAIWPRLLPWPSRQGRPMATARRRAGVVVGRGGGHGEDGPRPPGPPIMAALDTNRDGELSPEEIRNAAAALKSLDHNHDGTLDRSELEPRGGHLPGPDGPPDGPAARWSVRRSPAGRTRRTARRRFGGPPPRRWTTSGEAGPGRAAIGNVLPPFVREASSRSTDRQRKQIAELETT